MRVVQQPELPRLMWTVPEIARAVGLSERTIRRMIQRDEIEGRLLGGRILVEDAVLKEVLKNAPSAAE